MMNKKDNGSGPNDKWLTVAEAQKALALNGIEWTQVWIRTLIAAGKIYSQKMFNSRVIPTTEISRIVKEKRSGR